MSSPTVTKIALPFANAYLVRGARPILVDTGSPGDADKLAQAIERAGVRLADLALILLTHGHGDHMGSAAELRRRSGAPVAVTAMDAPSVRSGRNPPLHPTGLAGQLLLRTPIATAVAEGFEPDMLLDTPFDLTPFGVAGRVIATPGHTPGSVAALLDGGAALVGDNLMGGFMGGQLLSGVPGVHYFADDLAAARQSVRAVLASGAQTLYVGHGGPLTAAAVRGWLDRQP